MIMFLIRALIFVASAALGIVVADLVLEGFVIDWSDWWGFVLAVLIFAVLQSVLAPWITKVARRNAPALLGGIGIISTLVALLIVVVLPIGGIRITDALSWVLAPVIIWVVTALATLLLPMIFIKNKVEDRRDSK
ncbi:hypothetical protein [Microbacterium sp. NPDC076911]|uniref:hypothetical protein n=1 Tax=Microbacterium sp. NPDC076911 TaxID=3154958 RepID=UPI003428FA5A